MRIVANRENENNAVPPQSDDMVEMCNGTSCTMLSALSNHKNWDILLRHDGI